MLSMRLPRSVFAGIVFCAFLQAGFAFAQLPERMASHFAASGAANGWMSKPAFFAVYAAMIGKMVNALSRIDSAGGKVFIEGEHWNAVSDVVIKKDEPVEIVGITGLTLKVKPKN